MNAVAPNVSVLCVDDNVQVADAVRIRLSREKLFTWSGWLPAADKLVETVERDHPGFVLLDLDLPGRDPLIATADLARQHPEVRVIVFSGLVRQELIERALDAGVWGYVSKNDGEGELVSALRTVHDGNIALSTEAAALYYGNSGP